MNIDVYEKLAQHLDSLPAGYPRTESGVEMRILRQLFTPEEAQLSPHLTLIAETATVIARRAKMPVIDVAQQLEQMEKKGLLYVEHDDGKEPRYQAAGFVIGIYEFQLNRLNPQIAKDFEEYAPYWFNHDLWKKAPQLRTIPVGASIEIKNEVLAYEKAEDIVKSVKKIAAAPCVCRREKQVLGEGCNKPLESCLVFNKAADYYIHNGMGREITVEETLQILDQANKSGLVLQPGNSAKPMSICTCCGCCCGVLLNIKRHPKPASVVSTPFVATLEKELCNGCGICVKRCQMDALVTDSGVAELNLDRCIGCGLCVSTCSKGALRLQRKPESEQSHIPKNSADAHIKLGKAQGKLKNSELVSMVVKSKVDRLLALKESKTK
jgi:Na+-translocating ferredoxin:NAD+ oxidoreductase subunit B